MLLWNSYILEAKVKVSYTFSVFCIVLDILANILRVVAEVASDFMEKGPFLLFLNMGTSLGKFTLSRTSFRNHPIQFVGWCRNPYCVTQNFKC